MSKAAMKVKLNDAAAYVCRLNNEISKLKRALLKATGNKCYKQKRIIKQIRNKMLENKMELLMENDKKIKIHSEIQGVILLKNKILIYPIQLVILGILWFFKMVHFMV